ncbi:hypothetical protein KG088_12885 [Halomonas sp. TRM85114]|uniref:hypothetical protein n=1 Tax=Halomonas jincaotanensis TaxID=2810616 RepID=UPI001BD3F55F|nr:hypothetical protein [Halomonas jincaotanensis]MBS9404527.1 hypothetical protein [Halomonas jincaotanensis]
METQLSDFEQNMRRELDAFMKPTKTSENPAPEIKPTAKPDSSAAYKTGHIVKLAVRTKQLEMDTVFEYVSSSISKLEARMEAERAAKKAGYPIIGYVIDTQRL